MSTRELYDLSSALLGSDKMPINQEKLIKLQQQKEKAQIGGKVRVVLVSTGHILTVCVCVCVLLQGTARRKKKVVHKTATDDKKLQV